MKTKKDLLLSFYDHRAFCVNYLIKKTGCPRDDAEDVFLEAILDLQEKDIDFASINNMRSYLVTTSYNHWKRLYTKVKKQQEAKSQVVRYFYHYLPHRHGEEEDFLEQQHVTVQQAFKRLTEQCKTIISLFYLESKTMSQIAEKMGFKSATVATTMKYRCFNKLRKIVTEYAKN